ncbi:MAG TPA: hypothetical protein VIU11_14935 [Nakamurella sp.]
MSRPPNPHSAASTGRGQTGDRARLEYLPLEFADLLALQEDLADTRLGRPPAAPDDGGEEADVTRTFMELSALVGHVLSVYQRQQAAEAFIGTAQAPSSLVRHARRLAYDPDPGLAASGHVVLFAKENVSGTVAAGLALASVPLGESKAEDFQTRDDVLVDAALNELVPRRAQRAVVIADTARELRVQGVGHRVQAGDRVALVGQHWRGFIVAQAIEDGAGQVTIVTLDRAVGAVIDVAAASDPPLLLAHPERILRPFGVAADPALFPPASIKGATGTEPATFPKYWYEVQRADGGGYDAADIYLSEQVADPLIGGYLLRATGGTLAVLKVTAENVAAVTLRRQVEVQFTTQTVKLTPIAGGGFTTTLIPATGKLIVAGHFSATGTAIRVVDQDGAPSPRAAQPIPAEWLAGWATEMPLAATAPNPSAVTQPLELTGLLPALTPGRPVVFRNRAGTAAQVIAIRRAELNADEAVTRIWWDPVTPTPEAGWRLDDVTILGNVARVSHGRTVSQTLGGSDGVSAFQSFVLGQSPLTVLPGVAGGEPELEVRVDDVRWDRVVDFASSGPDDRHYRSVTDEIFVTTVVFGDGRTGAVPPSGSKNISATYRVGLGSVGNVESPRLSRLKRAHPLLDRVLNVTSISGGTEPADPAAVRTQATRWIRTFDRAVSVSDLADLALTMPGIARAAARWDPIRGAVLVVATAAGEAPPDLAVVRAFLDARRDATLRLELDGPHPREVYLGVEVDPDPAFLVEVVKDGVRQALHGDRPDAPGLFTFPARGLGQPGYLSEVYARVESVTGVVGGTVTGFYSRDGAGVVDVIPADVDEWLRLRPQDLALSISTPRSPS